MQCRVLIVVAALCVCAMSSEVVQSDEAVPEESFMQMFVEQAPAEEDSFMQSLDEAQQKVDDMKKLGQSQNACRTLVKDSRDAVTASVKASQKALESMPKGKACKSTYDALMQIHKDAKEKAARRIADAISAKSKIDNQKIRFDPVPLNKVHAELKQNRCPYFFGSRFTKAKAAQKAAAAAIVAAKAAAPILAKLQKSEERAARDIMNACLCKTKTDLLNAFKKAKQADASTKKAWDFAGSIECVLDGKTTSSCRKTNPLALKMPLATAFAEKYDCKKGALEEIARKDAKATKKWNAGAPKRAAARAAQDRQSSQARASAAATMAAAVKRCESSVPHCQPGRVKCEALGYNCRGGYTYNSNAKLCQKPAGYSTSTRQSKDYYAWVNCCDGCNSGEQCTKHKYFDVSNSHSACTCKTTKYTPADAYGINPNLIVGKCQACNSGGRLDASGQCLWNTVCQAQNTRTPTVYAWADCSRWCPAGASHSKHCVDRLGCSSSYCDCSKTICKRSWNGGYY